MPEMPVLESNSNSRDKMTTRVVQVSNISPSASREQLYHMFGYLGRIDELKVYPSETNALYANAQSKLCYIKFDDPESVAAAQHMTNTVFIDRALICVPVQEGKIPDEEQALKVGGPQVPGQRQLPPNIVNQIQVVGSQQLMVTIDPSLAALGLPAYPSLPSNTDATKMEEIRRTIYVGNLPKDAKADEIVDFFGEKIGEVMYLRMAGDESASMRYAYVEFTNQHSVLTALQNNGIEFMGNKLRIQHSTVAIIKPRAKTQDMAKKEVEEALKKAEAANPMIAKGMDADEVLRRFPVAAEASSRSPSRRRSRSRSGGRSERRRSRSPSKRLSARNSSTKRSPSRRHSRSRERERSKRRSRSREQHKSRDSRRRSSSRSRRSPSPPRKPSLSLRREERDRRTEKEDRDRHQRHHHHHRDHKDERSSEKDKQRAMNTSSTSNSSSKGKEKEKRSSTRDEKDSHRKKPEDESHHKKVSSSRVSPSSKHRRGHDSSKNDTSTTDLDSSLIKEPSEKKIKVEADPELTTSTIVAESLNDLFTTAANYAKCKDEDDNSTKDDSFRTKILVEMVGTQHMISPVVTDSSEKASPVASVPAQQSSSHKEKREKNRKREKREKRKKKEKSFKKSKKTTKDEEDESAQEDSQQSSDGGEQD